MHFHILTLFPEMVMNGLNTSILGRAVQKGLIAFDAVDIRDYTENKHNRVDDYPYGGGAGMLMQAQPVYDAYCAVRKKIAQRGQESGAQHVAAADNVPGAADAANIVAGGAGTARPPRVIYLTPQGRVFDQEMAREFAREEDLIFLCGHYEGIDERVLEEIVTDGVSIGDYVLTGGELPSMVMIDAISRMVPGVLKNEVSGETESFHENLLEYPQYTRPEVWKDKPVPQVLLSGDHKKVDAWRLEQSIRRTKERRPDLYEKYDVPGRAVQWLLSDKLHHMDMIEAIRRGEAEVAALRKDGVLLRRKGTERYLASAETLDAGERLLSAIEGGIDEICCHQQFLAESAERRFGLRMTGVCNQAVYTKKIPAEPVDDGTAAASAQPTAAVDCAALSTRINAALEQGRTYFEQFPAEDSAAAETCKSIGMKISKKKIFYLQKR